MTGALRRCLVGFGMLAGLQACATISEQVVRVGEEDSVRTVELATGKMLEIRLPTFPARGLTISLGSVVTPALRLAGTPTHNDDTMMGALGGTGGTGSFEIWRFRAMQPGEVKVRMDYRLQWETTGPPTRSVTYNVAVR
ncbi:MAG: protease inhibitor I42 family protein [Lautropia sp.]|nr:protease inhibitor I42 family protein [Lautropia sp.]